VYRLDHLTIRREMGYSTSKETLMQRLPDLQLLIQGKGCIWTVEPHDRADKFAYKIREALYIASLYPDEFPELVSARENFVIEVVSVREVQARKSKGKAPASVRPFSGYNTGLEDIGLPKRVIGAHTADTIIQSWLDTQPSNDRYFFPEANLPAEELLKLHEWAETKKLLFFVASDGALTLQKYDSSLDGLSWGPADLEINPEEEE
jgi:hypothetical protein